MPEKKGKVKKVMDEYREGKLKSGSGRESEEPQAGRGDWSLRAREASEDVPRKLSRKKS